jgi:hypothetical protein
MSEPPKLPVLKPADEITSDDLAEWPEVEITVAEDQGDGGEDE